MKIPGWLESILIPMAFIVVTSFCIFLLVFGSSTWQEFGHPLINTTSTFGGSIQQGWIDTNGVGYLSSVYFDASRGLSGIEIGKTYNIVYFCDGDGNRRIHSAKDVTIRPMPTVAPDPFKCVNVSGECR